MRLTEFFTRDLRLDGEVDVLKEEVKYSMCGNEIYVHLLRSRLQMIYTSAFPQVECFLSLEHASGPGNSSGS